MMEFLSKLFDASDFVPRWVCGNWESGHGWLHILSDLGVWAAYVSIPLALLFFSARRRDLPHRGLFWLFSAFILACGTTHLLEAVVFWWPAYRLVGLMKLLTAVISWVTVVALIPVIPRALAMRSPKALEREIAERQKAEAALRLTEAELRRVLASVSDCLWSFERDGDRRAVRYLSPVIERIAGRPPEAFPTVEAWEAVVHPDDRAAVAEAYGRVDRDDPREMPEIEYRIVRPDGSVRWVRNCARVSRDAAGRCRVDGVLQDVTERRRSEAALRLRDRALEVIPQGLIITAADDDLAILYANPGFEALSGYMAQEVLGRNCRFLQGPDTDSTALEQLRQAVREQRGCAVVLRNYRKDGTPFWNALSISPVRDEAGRVTHFVGVQADVTELRRLEDQLHQSQKMEAVGQLAGGVAHDFNNLLTVINGYSEMLEHGLRHEDPSHGLAREIRKAGERAATLTRQLLAFSRKTVVSPQVLELNERVLGTAKMLRRLIGEDIELITSLASDLLPVVADPGQVDQVVINLTVNARDAMPRGGKLTIETRNAAVDEAYSRLHAGVPPGEYVMLAVSDTGCGMTSEVRARIFEPFFTTKGPGKGTGLGLATVYGIVKQAAGHVDVTSEVGQGTSVKVYFPLARRSPGPGKCQSVFKTEVTNGNATILLAEDEPAVRALARHVLQNLGYRVLEAGYGEEALRVAQAHAGPIDLLVTDVVMPRMGGRELAERLRGSYPEVRVLFLSGYADDAVVRHGVFEAEVNFLQKPYSTEALARKVRDVLAEGPLTSQPSDTWPRHDGIPVGGGAR